MRSLFWKIFLYFLLIIVLVSGVVVVLTFLRDQEFPPLAHQGFARRAITDYGLDAIKVYEQSGVDQLDQYVDRLADSSGIRLVLFDQTGRALTKRMVPRRMLRMAQRAMRSGEIVLPRMGMHNGLAGTVVAPSGATYVVSVSLPEQPRPRDLVRGVTHGFLGWQLLLLLAVTALVCYVLARSLTSPIGQLRSATRRFAAGDLSTRIGSKIAGSNELAGLARDFDEMAEKIEVLVGSQQRLLRDISHELRSPLARLGIALELARQHERGEPRRKALDRIELESERMNDMIGQLLSLTRLESHRSVVPMEPFDLADLLARLVKDADFEAASRNCHVLFNGPEQCQLTGSEELLAQAFENMIRNAVKYTADGSEVQVTLRVHQHELIVQVADRGPGVPEDSLAKIFDPFYRVADDRDRKSGGTGIGLAIAQRAVHLHHGSIAASNRPDGGLLIEVRLNI